ncbi:unnamed protein product [Ilex paraguariensis]|uniref:Inositol-pentakisphosphate 2-kinase n=1 Tax=Ilex paraguariensis TaxID=185542 RepID=A0ABC8U415_9AQUA
MEVALEAKDAGEWVYRGEGAINLVLAYNGSSPDFIGKVLRIQKVSRNESHCEKCPLALNMHECLLWKETKNLVSAPTREIAEQLYVQHVMSPLLGSEHVDAGIRILVSREFLEAVEKNVHCQRPSWRVDAAMVNPLCDSALLISDHAFFPHGILKENICVSVEIKPKCGFLPLSEFIAEGNTIKRSTTRFKMYQTLKLQQGKVSEISTYDPLDIFSGSKDRVHKAVKDLFATPQNNFRVFLNGSLIFGGLGGGVDSTSCMVGKAFEDVLKCIIWAEDGMRTINFLELVAEAIFRSGLLDRLLKVQKLDVVDIEGAIHAYYDIISQPCMVCRELGEGKLSEKYTSLHSIPLNESLKIVRDFLIAATGKDLSMMYCFRPRKTGDLESPYGGVLLESTNQSFDCKVVGWLGVRFGVRCGVWWFEVVALMWQQLWCLRVPVEDEEEEEIDGFWASFIDLDMKPLMKMEYYYELDQQIVSCYSQKVKAQHKLENATSIAEVANFDQSNVMEDAPHSRDTAGNWE